MKQIKQFLQLCFFGLLSVAVLAITAGIAAFAFVLTPVIVVFTVLWLFWFITKDFGLDDDQTSSTKQDDKE